MSHSKVRFALITGSFLLSLSACGGGGGGSGGAAGPMPDPQPKLVDPLPEYLYDMVLKQGVSPGVARAGFANYEANRAKIRNGRFLTLIDFTKHSSDPRLYLIDIASGKVDAIHVAHGSGSDPQNIGIPQYFSNVPNSRKSSLGSYLISEKYYGKYGASMRTDGLDQTNSLVRPRFIVIHPSNYVKAGRDKQGMSWGCPAIPYAWIDKAIERLKDGSFMYIFGMNRGNAMADAMAIEDIMLNPAYRWINEAEEAPINGE